ncbi:unknown protein [Azorhizobium caulinodans ORS 571]|uniref:Uncharacterized protein n=1 Tax=Azorhizobium caulinodans (strain ATCC 43989 / DSM 5975 / JCM 20966 / LMG 6465 / NBRC 14845 / NCIMB 13405 / ORS 571) TaxID=438753 RepID=A8I7S2_AZOC5|nr:hypothetical protein [Azorhizobium caulinodans]BAF88153.1 unknown protein [Azorhizobium caulinodans ORS 571]
MTSDLLKLPFVVTEAAGPKVAGRSARVGETLHLTEFEARTELLAGVIRPAPADPEAPQTSGNSDTGTTTGEAEPRPARRR